jgi:hypothetical protein
MASRNGRHYRHSGISLPDRPKPETSILRIAEISGPVSMTRRVCQVRSAQVCSGQIRVTQVCSEQFRSGETRSSQVCFAQVRSTQVPLQ